MAEGLKQFQSDTSGDANSPDKHFVSKGEHRFDRITYAGFGYVANVLLSLGAVYWVERMPSGQKFMNNLVGGIKKMAPKINEKTAQYLASKSFFLTGGFAVLVPMKMLEDRKVELIKKWDKEIYGEDAETNPQLAERHRELEAAPKQSWASIMGSRMLALLPFYATVGLVWSNKSKLAQVTNSEFRSLDKAGKAEILAKEDTNLPEFAQHMKKGVFFDRPIAAVSRWLGKGTAKLTGNAEAVSRIEEMGKQYPAMLKEGAPGERDPVHSALPYYFISEAITSAIVARAVYLLTRVLGPIVGKDGEKPAEKPKAPLLPQPYVHADVEESTKVRNAPATQISAASIEHHATAAKPELQAALQ